MYDDQSYDWLLLPRQLSLLWLMLLLLFIALYYSWDVIAGAAIDVAKLIRNCVLIKMYIHGHTLSLCISLFVCYLLFLAVAARI